jgi:hypothetical protein
VLLGEELRTVGRGLAAEELGVELGLELGVSVG